MKTDFFLFILSHQYPLFVPCHFLHTTRHNFPLTQSLFRLIISQPRSTSWFLHSGISIFLANLLFWCEKSCKKDKNDLRSFGFPYTFFLFKKSTYSSVALVTLSLIYTICDSPVKLNAYGATARAPYAFPVTRISHMVYMYIYTTDTVIVTSYRVPFQRINASTISLSVWQNESLKTTFCPI